MLNINQGSWNFSLLGPRVYPFTTPGAFPWCRWWHCGLASNNCTQHLMTKSAQTKKIKEAVNTNFLSIMVWLDRIEPRSSDCESGATVKQIFRKYFKVRKVRLIPNLANMANV